MTSTPRDPFGLDWQAFCLDQSDLPGLVADNILDRQSRGRHSSESWREQSFLGSLEESLNSATSEHYPILTVCDPSSVGCAETVDLSQVVQEKPKPDRDRTRTDLSSAENTHSYQQVDYIRPTEAKESPAMVRLPGSVGAAPGPDSSKTDQVVTGSWMSKVNTRNMDYPFEPISSEIVGNPFEAKNSGEMGNPFETAHDENIGDPLESRRKTSTEVGDKTPPNSPDPLKNGLANTNKQSSSKDKSGFSRNISNPALRERARAKLEDFYPRGDISCRSVLLPASSKPPEADDAPDITAAGPSGAPAPQTFTKKLQPGSSHLAKHEPASSNKTTVTQSSGKVPGSGGASFASEQIKMPRNAPRQPLQSSITFARSVATTPPQIKQMYGLPGLYPNPLQSSTLFSNRLSPEDSDELDLPEDHEEMTYTNADARNSKDGISPKTPREDSPQFFSSIHCRAVLPDTARPTDSQIAPTKSKNWWQKSSILKQAVDKSVSDPDAAALRPGQTPGKSKRLQFGQSVSLGVMRRLGMARTPPRQQQQSPVWNSNVISRAQGSLNPETSKQRRPSSSDKTVAPVIISKSLTKASTVTENSEASPPSPTQPKSKTSTRIVNGVRVTGTSSRAAISGNGQACTGALPGAGQGQRPAGDGSESSGSLECSCSLYHSHRFPGQPVNRDVLARMERREDAIMASLKMEEEALNNKDMIETPHNIFWTPTLTFHPYRHGDTPVDFADLWPSYRELREHLQNSGIQNTVLRGDSVLDLCVLACTCGPAHLLQCLIELQLIRVDQTLEDGSGLLHLAALSQNAASVQYLVHARVSPRIRDRRGLTADQLCFSSHVRRLMAPRYVLSRDVSRDRVLLQPSLQDKDAIFKMASNPAYFVDIQKRLQTLDFNVNTECDNNGDFLLHVAVRQGLGQLPLLMALVKIQRADIELCNADGMTALMLSAAAGNCVLTDVLICLFGADPNKPNSQSGRSALHYATEGNHRKTVECLIRRGADVNLEDHDGLRPDDIPVCSRATAMLDDCSEVIRFNRGRRLHMLADLVRKNELLADQLLKSDFCVVDDQEYTLVMTAVLSNRANTLAMLLRFNDATMNAQHSKTGMTALALAAQAGHKECVAILLRAGASPVISDMQGYLPLHHAVLNNQEGAVEEILERFPDTYVGLYKAIRMCKRTSIHTMLRDAWDRRQEEIVTPKMLGCALVGEAKELYLLLDEGDNINPKSGTGNWPLYLAVENGHLEVVKLLFERGGDIRKRHPTSGATVLHLAASMGHQAVVSFLLQYCRTTTPPPLLPTSHTAGFLDSQSFQPKQTVLARATSFTSLVWGRGVTSGPISSAPRLVRSGSDGLTVGGRKQLLDINAVDKDGKTAMQLAAEKGLSNIVELLLHHGATTSLLDEQGQLITCPQFEGLRIMVERHRHNHTRQVMNLILEGKGRKGLEELHQIWLPKFDHHLRTKEGDTPLMLAAYKGRVPVLEFLLRSAVYSEASQHESENDSDSDADSGVLDPSLNYKSKEDFALSMDAGPVLASFSTEFNNDFRPMINNWRALNSSELVNQRVSRMVSDATKPKELSIFHDGVISHVCAVNLRNGSTALHNAVRGGDSAQCLSLLLAADRDPLNAQDSVGETVLHTACRLNRRKCVELLLTFPDLDLDIRTLEGSLPSEITTSKAIVKMLEKAKLAAPAKDIDTSLVEVDVQVRPPGSDKSPSMLGSTVNFDKVHSRYEALKYRSANHSSPRLTAVTQET